MSGLKRLFSGPAAERPAEAVESAPPPYAALTSGEGAEPGIEADNRSIGSSDVVWALSRPPIGSLVATSLTPAPEAVDDTELVARVQAAYRAGVATYPGSLSFWDVGFAPLKEPIHQALMADAPDEATSILRDPASNTHFWGFDAISSHPAGALEPHENVMRALNCEVEWAGLYARWLHDALVSLAEAVGARRMFYPETTGRLPYKLYGEPADADVLIDEVEGATGVAIHFPNPYPGEFGLSSRRGIIGFRSLQALYQAWRLARFADGRADFRVIEIGAGLGRTAYFAAQFGIVDYTIVDVPMTNAAQGYFLGRALGPERVTLHGEAARSRLRVLPPQAMSDMSETFDLMLNVDSLTELAPEVAEAYWRFARSNCDGLLAINHEFNALRVRDLYARDPSVRVARHPYWMRRGYVEEHVTWRHRLARASR